MANKELKEYKYINGLYKCEIVHDYGDSYSYIPLEGAPKNQIGKTFTASKTAYLFSNHRTPTETVNKAVITQGRLEKESTDIKAVVEPEYKQQIRRAVEDHIQHGIFPVIDNAPDQYRGVLGHKRKHIDMATERIWSIFLDARRGDAGTQTHKDYQDTDSKPSPTQSQLSGSGEEK